MTQGGSAATEGLATNEYLPSPATAWQDNGH